MRRLFIDGKNEEIPAFPHQKNLVYRADQFFRPSSFLTHLTTANFITIKELFRGYKNGCNIPRVLLIDPTSSCNLKCKGCWAADYSKTDNLSYDTLDDIVTQSEQLGIMDVYMTGGEPLIRKKDILRLCEKHRKTTFAAYTNATLIDDDFADEMKRVENLIMFPSIEGTKEETDFRRGDGTYDKVIAAMRRMKDRDIAFAFSVCYHSKNYKTVSSDEFLDDMYARGAWFGWMFNYMPIGRDADLSLVCAPEQRAYVHEKVSSYCKRNRRTVVDFWNSGHAAYGCVGAGSGFIHINARGDVEPCTFCHYSDANIHDMTLTEALRSPFLTKFRAAQPFSDNPFRPCPMVDVPEAIVKVVRDGNAHSTHYRHPESAPELAAKTSLTAEKWKPVAEDLKKTLSKSKLRIFKNFVAFLKLRRRIVEGAATRKARPEMKESHLMKEQREF